MCLSASKVRQPRKWNWDGDWIVHDTVIKAMRKTPTSHRSGYDIDIREFLGYDKSAVIGSTLSKIIGKLSAHDQALFRSKKLGSFDFRAQVILRFLSENVNYVSRDRGFDAWLFPEETLAEKGGDCEDRAFLLAALLLASGITGYCVRVVLGKLYNHAKPDPAKKSHDHVWVMYKNEEGSWQLLEPMIFHPEDQVSNAAPVETQDVMFEYVPYYSFNDTHLWYISNRDGEDNFDAFCKQRRTFFTGFNPSFAVSVHKDLFNSVLRNHLSWFERAWVSSYNFTLDSVGSLGPLYNPFQHFDNGYIPDAWNFVQQQISQKSLSAFVRAGHAIADFYAHSSYAEYAKPDPANNRLLLWDGNMASNNPLLARTPDYGLPPFTTPTSQLSVNKDLAGNLSHQQVVDALNQHVLISGRFAQDHDSQSTLEGLVIFPADLKARSDYAWRGSLPHHDEIAVDEAPVNNQAPSGHKLYSGTEYGNQFNLRKNTALEHMTEIYNQMGKPHLF